MRDTAGSAAAPAARCRKFRRGSFIFEPPSRLTSLDYLVGAGEQLKVVRPIVEGPAGGQVLAEVRMSQRSSGRYSKCIVSKCPHLPPQMKPCFSKICAMSKGKRFR